MTGNQYFWLLLVVVLVYSVVGIMEKWVRSKEAEAQIKMIDELIDQNERIHKENIALIMRLLSGSVSKGAKMIDWIRRDVREMGNERFSCCNGGKSMLEIELNMPIKSFNLNQLTNSNRANMYGAAAKKKKAMRDIYFLIKPQIKEPLTGKYKVSATWRVTSKNRDLDNLLLKNIFDSMQENNLLKNDNLNHIVEINHDFEIVKKADEGVTVRFEEVA